MNQNKQNALRCIKDARRIGSRVIGNPRYGKEDQILYGESAISALKAYIKYRKATLIGLPDGRLKRMTAPVRCQQWVDRKIQGFTNHIQTLKGQTTNYTPADDTAIKLKAMRRDPEQKKIEGDAESRDRSTLTAGGERIEPESESEEEGIKL
jgi:hypothetical protein